MTHTLRERRRQMLRDEILDTARTLVAEKGYAAMSMDDLAARVGISKPTLYSYFNAKDELVIAAAIRAMDRLLELIEAQSQDQSPLDHLKLIMRAIIERHVDEAPMMMHPWEPEVVQRLCASQEAVERIQRVETAGTALVQAAMAQGEIDQSLDPLIVVQAFFSLATAFKFHHLSSFGAQDSAVMADTLVRIFERGVGKNSEF